MALSVSLPPLIVLNCSSSHRLQVEWQSLGLAMRNKRHQRFLPRACAGLSWNKEPITKLKCIQRYIAFNFHNWLLMNRMNEHKLILAERDLQSCSCQICRKTTEKKNYIQQQPELEPACRPWQRLTSARYEVLMNITIAELTGSEGGLMGAEAAVTLSAFNERHNPLLATWAPFWT